MTLYHNHTTVQMIMSGVNCAGPVHKLVTYNAGMLYDFPLKDQRLSGLPNALSQLDADVICLPEVFFYDDILMIRRELQDEYPYSYSSLDSQDSMLDPHRAPCSGLFTIYTLACVVLRCNSKGDLADLVACSTRKCGFEYSISQECLICLGAAGADQIWSKCVTYSASTINVAGLLLLSRKPLINSQTMEFFPGRKQLFKKAMILTEVEEIGKLVCAHLTPRSDVAYIGIDTSELFTSWAQQNAYEADFLINTLQNIPRVIAMGDFNAGPDLPNFNVTSVHPDSFKKYISAGFESPYVKMVGLQTFLNENSIYDHVFHRGYKAVFSQRLYLNDSTGFSLSDHYGVEVWLTL